jgi:hypothetical protein
MDELREYQRFLSEITRRVLGANPHLLARWPFSPAREARLEEETPRPVYGGKAGGADEKRKGPSESHK